MAGDWIKVEVALPDKPEVIGIANTLGIDQDAVVGKLLRLWIWADQHTVDGNAKGNAASVTAAFVDRCTFVPGFAAAMAKVGWLILADDGVQFPNFDRHNGQTAKQRGLTAKRVATHKIKSNAISNGHSVSGALVSALPREERREEISSRRDQSTGGGIQSTQPAPSTGNVSGGKRKKRLPKFDLSHLTDADWDRIVELAKDVAKRVRPPEEDDRRKWLKYATLAFTSFSEAWLIGAAESARTSKDVTKSRQALFVRALQNAAKEQHGLSRDDFNAMVQRTEIRIDVWKSNALCLGGLTP